MFNRASNHANASQVRSDWPPGPQLDPPARSTGREEPLHPGPGTGKNSGRQVVTGSGNLHRDGRFGSETGKSRGKIILKLFRNFIIIISTL